MNQVTNTLTKYPTINYDLHSYGRVLLGFRCRRIYTRRDIYSTASRYLDGNTWDAKA
jgi:hypothetical protein